METDLTLTAGQIPPSFSPCFLNECPKTDTCLRFLAGKHIPDDKLGGLAIYPTVLKKDTCPCYKAIRVIHAAYGFNTLFKDIKLKDDTPLRNRIKAHVGGRSAYYRYHRGELLLTPEQQTWIIDLFRHYGYTEDLHFDGYRDVYDFT